MSGLSLLLSRGYRMSEFTSRIGLIQNEYAFKERRLVERALEKEEFDKNYQLYLNREKALSYIIMLSDDSTAKVRDYLANVINRALDAIFGKGIYRFYLQSDLENQAIYLMLTETVNGVEHDLDIKLQAGDGMGQVIAFLYSVILVEVTNHRLLILEDEVLGGLHEDAMEFVKKCVHEFAKHGGQFVIIEYTLENYGLQYDLTKDKYENVTTIAKETKFELDGTIERELTY